MTHQETQQRETKADPFPKFTKLLEDSHDTWRETKIENLEEFVKSLPGLQARAFCFAKLNYQVENGGYAQWHGNGYSELGDLTIRYLRELYHEGGGHLDIAEMADLTQQALKIIEDAANDFYSSDPYEEDMDGDEWREICSGLKHADLDSQYYRINQTLLQQAEDFFTKHWDNETE